MRIAEMIPKSSPFLSLEFFPPKEREAWPKFFEVVEKLKVLKPLFASVTYGAGGGTQDNTLEIVTRLKRDMGLTPMAHLTCVGASADRLHGFLKDLRAVGIDNVMALRGDPPRDRPGFSFEGQEFRHASDLVSFIRTHYPELCVAVAGYPETHVEAKSVREDLEWTRHKIAAGASFVVTQLFFDNRVYFDYVERLRGMGVAAPIIPGVLPIMSIKSAKFMLSLGGPIPGRFLLALEKAYEDGGDAAVKAYGLMYATKQIQELIDRGAPGVHLYTLNRADACLEIAGNLRLS